MPFFPLAAVAASVQSVVKIVGEVYHLSMLSIYILQIHFVADM